MIKLFCATTNPGKLREFRQIMEHYGGQAFDLEVLPSLKSVAAPEETGETFEANAALKAAYYSRLADAALFADDSGLEVDALGNAPGVYSARYAGEHATDAVNNALVRERLRGVANRRARFVCAIALADKGEVIATFRGEVEGRIVDEERGPNGFGYDPMFYHEPFGATFGEVPGERKLLVSHRAKALAAMVEFLKARVL